MKELSLTYKVNGISKTVIKMDFIELQDMYSKIFCNGGSLTLNHEERKLLQDILNEKDKNIDEKENIIEELEKKIKIIKEIAEL